MASASAGSGDRSASPFMPTMTPPFPGLLHRVGSNASGNTPTPMDVGPGYVRSMIGNLELRGRDPRQG